jgi:membrane-associated protease RseP (regulator of RpoE activity)
MMRKLLFASLLVGLVTGMATLASAQDRRFTTMAGGGPRLGVMVTELTEELRTHFGAPKESGVLIGKVEPGGAAAAAGIRVGDVLVDLGGAQVGGAWDVRRALGEKKEGEMVPATVIRERKPITLAVKVPKPTPGAPGLEGMTPPGFDFDAPGGGMRMFRFPDVAEIEKRLDDIEQRLRKLETH